MSQVANGSARLQRRPNGMTNNLQRARNALHFSAIISMASVVCASHAYAAYDPGFTIRPQSPVIKAGQQQSGQPLKIRGVFVGFNPSTRRLKLAQLDLIDFSWREPMRDVEVDSSVSMNALEPGMAVTATLTRSSNGRYYV